ncbi:1-deoxy-D-xylulose-5-phosphate synthase [Babesia caballi]|uniref:1-deoxy-D-xylulose-5-phosphate synthase n=1 Tax=Babesia caballi TaxID=5871 RepID=A0AAV4LUM8_BABCB|nr:1-deoxy-D-xylulose-5-phosphate synthase [Babesia caballi]
MLVPLLFHQQPHLRRQLIRQIIPHHCDILLVVGQGRSDPLFMHVAAGDGVGDFRERRHDPAQDAPVEDHDLPCFDAVQPLPFKQLTLFVNLFLTLRGGDIVADHRLLRPRLRDFGQPDKYQVEHSRDQFAQLLRRDGPRKFPEGGLHVVED